MRILYRPAFWRDVEETIVYLSREASIKVAIRWQDAAMKGVSRIINNPGRGHLRRDLKPEEIRALTIPPFHNHLIFYRWTVSKNELEFYRIRHGAMNLPRIFDFGGRKSS